MWKSRSRQDVRSPTESAPSVPGQSSGAAGILPTQVIKNPTVPAIPQVWSLATMLLLAMAGIAIASAYEENGWLAWSFIVIIYGSLSLWLDSKRAKQYGQPFWPMASRHIAHWL